MAGEKRGKKPAFSKGKKGGGRKQPVPKRAAAKKSARHSTARKSVTTMDAFNPLHTSIPPSLSMITNVFPINQSCRLDFDTVLLHEYMLIVSGVGGCANQGILVDWIPSVPASVPSLTNLTLPLVALSATAGGPTSSKISKSGLRIINSTAPLYMGGRCFVARLDQRFTLPAAPGSLTPAQWTTFQTSLKALPPSMLREYGAEAFSSNGVMGGRSMFSHVVDEIDYAVFDNHVGITSGNEFVSHLGVWPAMVELPRAMSTVVFMISAPASAALAQSLTIHVDSQLLTRWPIDTVPGTSAGLVPPSNVDSVNAARMKAVGAGAKDWGNK